jgi:hypothetical protein
MTQDEELDALVKQAMDRAIERLQKLHSHAGRPAWDQVICEELSKPFTTLRAQLAEALFERDAWRNQCRDPLSSSLAKAIENYRESLPVAIWNHIDALQKQIDYSANGKYGPVYSGPMVDAAFARADRAEAALAAQIEVDAGMIERIVIEARREVGNIKLSKVDAAVVEMLSGIIKAIRSQPHDRTALERMLAEAREQTALGMVDVMATTAKEAREKALREAAQVLTDEIDLARIAMPQAVPILAADRKAILALIEKEKEE